MSCLIRCSSAGCTFGHLMYNRVANFHKIFSDLIMQAPLRLGNRPVVVLYACRLCSLFLGHCSGLCLRLLVHCFSRVKSFSVFGLCCLGGSACCLSLDGAPLRGSIRWVRYGHLRVRISLAGWCWSAIYWMLFPWGQLALYAGRFGRWCRRYWFCASAGLFSTCFCPSTFAYLHVISPSGKRSPVILSIQSIMPLYQVANSWSCLLSLSPFLPVLLLLNIIRLLLSIEILLIIDYSFRCGFCQTLFCSHQNILWVSCTRYLGRFNSASYITRVFFAACFSLLIRLVCGLQYSCVS